MKPKRLTNLQRGLVLIMLLSLAISGIGALNPTSHAAPLADAPELFASDQLEGMSIADNTLYWYSNCGDDFSGPTSYLRSKSTATAAAYPPLTRFSDTCPADDRIASANVALDSSNAYWLAGDGRVLALPRTATSSTAPTQLSHTVSLTSVGGFPSCCSVTVDGTYIYWNEGKKVYRAVKSGGGSAGVLIYDGSGSDPNPGSAIRDLQAAGDGSLYILLGTRLSQLQLGGSAYTARLIADNATAYAFDSARLFWAIKSYRYYTIMSESRTSADIQTLYSNPSPDNLSVDNLTIDPTNIYWHDARPGAGRIYKLARTGGFPVALTADMSIGSPLLTDGTYLFWTDYNTGIYRLQVNSTPIPPADGDIWVTGMEVTQAIQTNDNQIPLVGYKTTMVRVYVQSREDSNGPWSGVTARLDVSGSSRTHLALPFTIPTAGSNRATLDDSFNFLLTYDETAPDTPARPERDLTVTIYPPAGRPESNVANDTLTRHFNFGPERNLEVVGVRYANTNNSTDPTCGNRAPNGVRPPFSDFDAHRQYVTNAYPLSNLYITPLLNGDNLSFDDSACLAYQDANNWASAEFDRLYPAGGQHGYVLTPENGPGYHGMSCGYGASNCVARGENLRVDPGPTMAQELAHGYFGRLWCHTFDPCSNFPRPDIAPTPPATLPPNAASIGPNVGIRFLPTLETAPGEQSDGTTINHDFMSYSAPYWVSPYTYCTLMNYISAGATLCPSSVEGGGPIAMTADPSIATDLNPAALGIHLNTADQFAALPATFLYVAGNIDENGNASFEPFEQINSGRDITTKSSGKQYSIALEDAASRTIAQYSFDGPPPRTGSEPPSAEHLGNENDMRFSAYLPWDPATARIVLLSNGKEIVQRTVSKNPPSVSLISPKGGEKLSGKQIISWQGSDADGDPLTYSVWYSPDGGEQWLPLDVNVTGNSTTIDFDTVPGSDKALIRVLASDGVNTTEARLASYIIVPRKAPQITLSAPQEGATFNASQDILLSATAFDWEDGALTNAASYNWQDENGNNLGAAPWTAIQLKPGVHTLTVSAKDSDGNVTSASVHITVKGEVTPNPQPTATPSPNPGPGSRFFPETGHTVKGRFLDYWNTHGGLAQQGYPISDEFQEKSATDGKVYTVQYFERAVFEYHPENKPPYDVLLSLLGNFNYQQKYPNGASKQTPNTSPGAVYYPQTGHHLGGVFLNYWNTHGGLAQQGYPISDEFVEVSELNGKPYLVQYFERAVFEYHPENTPPYNVLLSQLGTFQYKQRYGGK